MLDDGKEADARLELLAASRQEPSTTNWGLPMTMYHFTVPVYRVPQTKHSCMYVPETIALPKQAALPSGSLPPTILNHSFGSWKPLLFLGSQPSPMYGQLRPVFWFKNRDDSLNQNLKQMVYSHEQHIYPFTENRVDVVVLANIKVLALVSCRIEPFL